MTELNRTRVLLVHGAWHGEWVWHDLIPFLECAGLDPATVALPSAGGTGDLTDDAEAIRSALRAHPGPTVVVAHSYGGMPATEVVGDEPNVRALIYLSAALLDIGETIWGQRGGQPTRETAVGITIDDLDRTRVLDPIPQFYNDLDPVLAQQFADRLTTQTVSSFAGPLTQTAWRTVPSTYIICAQDAMMPVAVQEAMAARTGSVERLETGHTPMASQPEELARIIARVAAG